MTTTERYERTIDGARSAVETTPLEPRTEDVPYLLQSIAYALIAIQEELAAIDNTIGMK